MSDANPVAEAPLDALREARKALDSLWAAIGDRLLGKGPLAKEYANGVAQEVKYAIADIDAALSAPPPPPPREQELLGKEGGQA